MADPVNRVHAIVLFSSDHDSDLIRQSFHSWPAKAADVTAIVADPAAPLVGLPDATRVIRAEPTQLLACLHEVAESIRDEFVLLHDGRTLWREWLPAELRRALADNPDWGAVAAQTTFTFERSGGSDSSFRVLPSADGVDPLEKDIVTKPAHIERRLIQPSATLVRGSVFKEALAEANPANALYWGIALLRQGTVGRLVKSGVPGAEITLRGENLSDYASELAQDTAHVSGAVLSEVVHHTQLEILNRVATILDSTETLIAEVNDTKRILLERTTPEGGLSIPARVRLGVKRRIRQLATIVGDTVRKVGR
ncbi:hypothetical protein [Pseudoclavibacter caeni]|uniref:Uncharacterized protein n=1 Tax=Pseudoclavibacter caeni TaxID=908846 RepID=A0A7C8BMT2_9MICO|nr:hypothetical protein [Pseudoclavibacter caeni]KAB1631368.1 hypothetical protein F8O02_08355 [Pseudoclavibacter caeni]NYJ96770.1 hypothetical protein [Pseudoclavibacter caeni]